MILRSIDSRVYSSVEVGVGVCNHRHPTGDKEGDPYRIRIRLGTPRLAFVHRTYLGILGLAAVVALTTLCMVYKDTSLKRRLPRRGWLVSFTAPPKNPPMHIPRGYVVVSPPDFLPRYGNPTQPPINVDTPTRGIFFGAFGRYFIFYYPILDSFPQRRSDGGPAIDVVLIYRLP